MGQYLSLFFRVNPHNKHNNNFIDTMPQELSFLVMEYLSIRDLFIIQRVNRSHWYQLFCTWIYNQEALVFVRQEEKNSGTIHYHPPHGNTISDTSFFELTSFLDQAYQDYKLNSSGDFKFIHLKRVTLVQKNNLQNTNTFVSHFKLPLMREHPAGGFCYSVGRSAVSVDFVTASEQNILSKQKNKQRFSINFAANSSISQRRVGHLSLYGNYVHYSYNAQFDTNTTIYSAYVNAGSILGGLVEQGELVYEPDKSYCTTVFVDDHCYRTFVDEECDKVITSRYNEIKRTKEKMFKFRHTTDPNILCDVLDQLTITHNRDVMFVTHLSFHHIPSWVNKTQLFNEHSFSMNYSPDQTCIVHRNLLFAEDDNNDDADELHHQEQQ
jgi:hypothetical protein